MKYTVLLKAKKVSQPSCFEAVSRYIPQLDVEALMKTNRGITKSVEVFTSEGLYVTIFSQANPGSVRITVLDYHEPLKFGDKV